MRDWGCKLFVLGADIHVVHAGVRSLKERYAAFFAGG
jgi:4-hydroxy-2-oxoheptanedioate aldolase